MRADGCHVSLQIDQTILEIEIFYQAIIVKEREPLKIVEPILVIERTACQIL